LPPQPPPPATSSTATTIPPPIPDERPFSEFSAEVAAVIRSMRSDFKSCYQAILKTDPQNPGGRVVVSVKLAPTGDVESAKANGSLPDLDCFVQTVKRKKFPPPNEGATIFQFPITFTSQR
jgi:hypothetical protein